MTGPTYAEVSLALINEPPAPIRQAMNPDGIYELSRSIADHGQLQPIGLVRDGERYTISFGHRRFLALARLGDRPARALVFDSTTEAMLGAQLAENVDREAMGPVDEAYWFAQLLEGLQTDTTRLAERLKMNRAYIEGRLDLLHGDPDVLARLRLTDITLGIAKLLNTVGDTKMRRLLLDMCVQREAKVHTLTQWIAELKATGRLSKDDDVAAPVTIGDAADIEAPPPIQCCFCDDSDEPWTMEPYWIHKHCKKALGHIIRQHVDESPVRSV